MNVLQQRAALSSMKPRPNIEGAEEEQEGRINPFGILANAAYERNALISFPTYVDLGRVDETEPSTWQASVSVMYEREVMQATATASSKWKAKWNAAEVVLEKISLGNA